MSLGNKSNENTHKKKKSEGKKYLINRSKEIKKKKNKLIKSFWNK